MDDSSVMIGSDTSILSPETCSMNCHIASLSIVLIVSWKETWNSR